MLYDRKLCRFGHMIYPKLDQFIGRSLELYGEWSYGESLLFEQLVNHNDTVVDIGAHIGAHTVRFGQICKSVIAIEPQRLIYQLLCANVAMNHLDNVYCINSAVGFRGHIKRSNYVYIENIDLNRPNNSGACGVAIKNDGIKAKLLEIDSLKLDNCKLIKIDVEGMEPDVLTGASQTIKKFKPFLYFENHSNEDLYKAINILKPYNYKLYWHTPSLFNPDNFNHYAVNVFNGIVSKNILAVPDVCSLNFNGFDEVDNVVVKPHSA